MEIRKPTHAGAFLSANSVFWKPPGPPTNFEKCAGNLGKLCGASKEPLKNPENLRETSGNLREPPGTSGEPPDTCVWGETPGRFGVPAPFFFKNHDFNQTTCRARFFAFFIFFSSLRVFFGFCADQCARFVWVFSKCLALEHRSSHSRERKNKGILKLKKNADGSIHCFDWN